MVQVNFSEGLPPAEENISVFNRQQRKRFRNRQNRKARKMAYSGSDMGADSISKLDDVFSGDQ